MLLIVLAMNWEGHDDWMEDHPAAIELERQFDQAAPLPPASCLDHKDVFDNPYEQVPLRCGEEHKHKLEPLP